MKKIFSIALIACLITLSSCRTKTDTVVESPLNPSSPVTLTVWNLYDTESIFKGQIQSYTSKHANVKVIYKSFQDEIEYEQALINAIAEGEGPDIFAIKNTWIDKHKKKISSFPVGKTSIPLNTSIFGDTFFKVASEDLIRDGQIYAIPLFIDTLAIYYNQQIFRDNIPNTDKPAETWGEIENQVAQITKTNNSIEKFALSGAALGRPDNISLSSDIFNNILLQYGVELYNTAKTLANFASQRNIVKGLDTPVYPFTESLKRYSSFGNPSYKNYSWNEEITSLSKTGKEKNPFLEGKVAMIFGYSDLYSELINIRKQKKTLGDTVINESDIGVKEFPQILSFSETGKRDALAKYYPLTVSRNSKNPILAWDFIESLVSKESLTDYYKKTNKPSSRKDLIDEQMTDPVYGAFARQVSYSKSYPLSSPLSPETTDTIFSKALGEAIENKQELNTIALKAQERMNCELEKQKRIGETSIDCLQIQ